jgi:putative intracellular protease/amidase
LSGRRFTCHPGAAPELKSAQPVTGRVLVDGKLITGQAAGASFELALEVVALLAGPEAAEKVDKGLLYQFRK